MIIKYKTRLWLTLIAGFALLFGPLAPRADSKLDRYLLMAEQIASELVPLHLGASSVGTSGWLEEAEFRYSGSDQDDQSYALRVRPKFGAQRSAERNIFQLQAAQHGLSFELVLNDEVKYRYLNLIELTAFHLEVDYLNEQANLSEDAAKIYRSLAQTKEFDFEDLQEAELDYQHFSQQRSLHANRLNRLLRQLELANQGQSSILLDQWFERVASVPELYDIAALNMQESETSTPGLLVREEHLNLQLAQENLRLERSEKDSFHSIAT